MRVLVACEESQTVCKSFRKRGHEAYSCDLKECSGGHPEWHILGDAVKALYEKTVTTMDGKKHIIENWDIVIAHPPCTFLTNAGARWLYANGELNKDRYIKGLKGKELFMAFYYYGLYGGKICIENPVPSSIYELPKYSQIIEPYMFGHPVTKKTCLWLHNLPLLEPTNNLGRPEKRYFQKKDGTWRTTCWEMEQKGDRATMRSKTFKGIARAMATQWGGKKNNAN